MMMNTLTIITTCLLYAITTWYTCVTAAQEVPTCPPGENKTSFTIELETDDNPEETSYKISDSTTRAVYYESSETTYPAIWTIYIESYCLSTEGCYEFQIEDTVEDFNGYYELFWGGELIKAQKGGFGGRDNTKFGATCPTSSPSASPTGMKVTLSPSLNPSLGPSVRGPTESPSPSMGPTVSNFPSESPSGVPKPRTTPEPLVLVVAFPVVALVMLCLLGGVYMYCTGRGRKKEEFVPFVP